MMSTFWVLCLQFSVHVLALYMQRRSPSVQELSDQGMKNLKEYLDGAEPGNCNMDNAVKRYEWNALTSSQRREYIDAVLCLQKLPPKSSRDAVPGARSRFDDFVAVHIERTLTIHGTANFLAWHRSFTWAYEKALRDECGYTGYQPYWNWALSAEDPVGAAIFSGDEISMGGNGQKIDYPGLDLPFPPYSHIPPGEGGGCVTEGPFKDLPVNLGPVSPLVPDVPSNPEENGLGYNPRCLRRDINPNTAQETSEHYIYELIAESPNIERFQQIMNGRPELNLTGVHTMGHMTIGGDPGADLFSSPGDPAFYLHHAMLDRVYWIWQNQKLPGRLSEIFGTITFANQPPSRNGTLDDILNMGVVGDDTTLGSALNTMGGAGGRFCYVYV